MATLNALKKAPIINQDGIGIGTSTHTVLSSDPGVVKIQNFGSVWNAVGVAGGHATITATRNLDGAVATLEVDVVAAAPFSIALGTESAA